MKVYHNPRCSKSRLALSYLDDKGIPYEVVKYLNEPFSKNSLKELILKIGINADELLRKNEKFYKEEMKGKELSEEEIIDFMLKEPKLIERPIIEDEHRAIIGRPVEAIDQLL